MTPSPPRQPRIAILGAGPAGLSTAWFLKELGYRDVLVLEKLGRVGGLVESLNSGYRSFDLGANYVTPAYRETLKLARKVGAGTFPGKMYTEARERPGGRLEYRSISDYVREDPHTGEPIGFLKIAGALLKYARLRWGVRKWIDRPDFSRVHDNEDLCVSFEAWLDANDIGVLKRTFEIPITMMGYGFLNQIAAPYALKYLSMGSFLILVARGLPGVGRFVRWPRRFRQGFQRMWQRVSWHLDVRMNVAVKWVERTKNAELAARLPNAEVLGFEDNNTLQTAFIEERCDGWTADKSVLALHRSAFPADSGGPEALVILDETF